MQLINGVREVLVQMTDTLSRLTDGQYNHSSRVLSGASIGQHVRHVAELFICLENGYAEGVINYDNRKRDRRIETDRHFALCLLGQIQEGMDKPDKLLQLETGYATADGRAFLATTNYYREILYNLEHTVHHMALIRIGIESLSAVSLPDSFGVAASTIQYRTSCAQ